MRYANAVLLSFEGPDAYAMVGGLATRVTELAAALAAQGVATTLIFLGDPAKLACEQAAPKLEYRRWSQWLSSLHPLGVYDGEPAKVADVTTSAPRFIVEELVAPAARRGERTLILAEEWQTAPAAIALDALLRKHELRASTALLWNANNTYGFERINWNALRQAAQITTVSKFMKFELGRIGVESLVIPNGIPDRLARGTRDPLTAAAQRALPHHPLLVKIGRYDPDKCWAQAIDAFTLLRVSYPDARLIVRGGREAYGTEMLDRARAHGNVVETVAGTFQGPTELLAALAQTRAPIVEICSFIPEALLHALYNTADAVLANSAREPFGLVGLEVMACGGLAVCGATGEEYAEPFTNAIVCDTEDPRELTAYLIELLAQPKLAREMRAAGNLTAARYTWSRVLALLERKLAYVAAANSPANG